MAKICNIQYFDISISDGKSGALEINKSEDSIEPFGYESSSQFEFNGSSYKLQYFENRLWRRRKHTYVYRIRAG